MKIRWVILVLVLAAVGYGATRFVRWKQEKSRRQYQHNLAHQHDDNPLTRLAALDGLIAKAPLQSDLRLRRVRTLMELKRYKEARNSLQVMIDRKAKELKPVLALQITCFLEEAAAKIDQTPTIEIDNKSDEIVALAEGAKAQINLLAGGVETLQTLTFKARRLHVLAKLNAKMFDSRQAAWTTAKLTSNVALSERAGYDVETLKQEGVTIDNALAALCSDLLETDATLAEPVSFVFYMHLRRREFDEARAAAERLIEQPTLSMQLVAHVVDSLLDIEMQYAEPVTQRDISIADKLLGHSGLTGRQRFLFAYVARANHALQSGRYADAERIALEGVRLEPFHSRLRSLIALSKLGTGEIGDSDISDARQRENDVESAIQMLISYNERVTSSRCMYVLGKAYLQTGQRRYLRVAQDTLRQALDLRPGNLPARLALVESLIRDGHVLDAEADIKEAEALNPNHPRVIALKVNLAVSQADLGTVAQTLVQQIHRKWSVVTPVTVTLVASMLFDDVNLVRESSRELKVDNAEDVYALVADSWVLLKAKDRGKVAPVVVRTLLNYLDRDPLARPTAPHQPVFGEFEHAGEKARVLAADQQARALLKRRFIADPHSQLHEILEIAIDRWPDEIRLAQLAASAALWLGDAASGKRWLIRLAPLEQSGEPTMGKSIRHYLEGNFSASRRVLTAVIDSQIEEQKRTRKLGLPNTNATSNLLTSTQQYLDLLLFIESGNALVIHDVLRKLLAEHPWAERALLVAIGHAIREDQMDRALALIAMARQINPELALLTKARLHLVTGNPAEARRQAMAAIRNEPIGAELRRWAVEVRIEAHLEMKQLQLAVGAADQLALHATEHRRQTQMVTADVLLAAGRKHGASQVLSRLLSPADNSARLMDQLLTRAQTVMKPSRIKAILDSLLALRDDDSTLLMYQARLAAHDNLLAAERVRESLLAEHPDSIRLMMEGAVMQERHQPDQAIRLYRKLLGRGGWAARAAQQAIDRIVQPPSEPRSKPPALNKPQSRSNFRPAFRLQAHHQFLHEQYLALIVPVVSGGPIESVVTAEPKVKLFSNTYENSLFDTDQASVWTFWTITYGLANEAGLSDVIGQVVSLVPCNTEMRQAI
jgi:tetratricopeptide (TPR) repeat protein